MGTSAPPPQYRMKHLRNRGTLGTSEDFGINRFQQPKPRHQLHRPVTRRLGRFTRDNQAKTPSVCRGFCFRQLAIKGKCAWLV